MQRTKTNETLPEMKSIEDLLGKIGSNVLDSPGDLRRELQILKLHLEQNTYNEIASQLSITEGLVQFYRYRLIRRLSEKKSLASNASQPNTVHRLAWTHRTKRVARPPFNAEYVLYLLLRRDERDVVIGDLVEDYGKILERFNKRRADIWFYKQVGGSLLPLLRRALLRIGALVWLGRILRRLVS